MVHTLFVREHNRLADAINKSDPSLDGNDIFKITRAYDEFLPALLGEGSLPEYRGYKRHVDTGLENIVTSCAYRLGHTMAGDSVSIDRGGGDVVRLPMEESFFAPEQLETRSLDPFLRGLATSTCEEIDPFLVPSLRNHLFMDMFNLTAINI